jgi:hypothetical protein
VILLLPGEKLSVFKLSKIKVYFKKNEESQGAVHSMDEGT